MTSFTVGEIGRIRQSLLKKLPMADICGMWVVHTRDEIVEAIDAIRRHENDWEAMDYVNRVLFHQERGDPLINGWPAWEVLEGICAAVQPWKLASRWANSKDAPFL